MPPRSPTKARAPVPRSEYIETDSGNRISRKSSIQGSQFIVLGGKTIIEHDVELRGDLHRADSSSPVIAIGRYTVLGHGTSVVPPVKKDTRYPVKIGSYVCIGPGCKIEAASIGSCVHIGANCSIGMFAIIKDCVVVADGAVIPPFSVIAPFSYVGPKVKDGPAVVLSELPESADEVLELYARRAYAGIDVGALPFGVEGEP